MKTEGGLHFVNYLLSKAVPKNDMIPTFYRDTLKLNPSEREGWNKAMKEELKALNDRNVWELVKCPKNRIPVKCRWVYAVKSDGRKRARLVAKGYSQIPGQDYDETFSPVARFETVRLLLALSAIKNWDIELLDVKTAFLYGNLDEEIYSDSKN
jgi:Reverse transcriptase (RNA-dependent DNA polymerase)